MNSSKKQRADTKVFLFPLLILLCAVTSCSSLSLREYFIKPGVMQYFISGLEFKGSGLRCVADITYRNNQQPGAARLNFFLYYGRERVNHVEKVFIKTKNETFEVQNIQLLFRKVSKKYLRYTSEISSLALKNFLCAKNSEIKILINRGWIVLKLSPFQESKKNEICRDVFALMY